MVGMARSMLKAKRMPAAFCGEAVSMVVFILNRAPTKSLKGTTPFEAWHGRKPGVSFPGLDKPTCPVKPGRSGSGLPDRFDRKPVETSQIQNQIQNRMFDRFRPAYQSV